MLGSVFRIEVMDALLHQCIVIMILRIYGSLATQRITGSQLRIMQRVLDGEFFTWGLKLHARMIGQIHQCWTTDSDDFAFGSILVAWFLERVPMLCPRVFLPLAGPQKSRLMRWAQILAQHGWRGWPLFYGHIGKCVAPHATNYTAIPIWWDGFSERIEHRVSSWRGLRPERYVCSIMRL
jgi:hypothetical protein